MTRSLSLDIPDGFRFSSLHLRREANGDVTLDLDVLRTLLADPADLDWLMSSHESNLAQVLTQLYAVSVAHCGAEDPTFEQLIAEMRPRRRPRGPTPRGYTYSLRIYLTPEELATLDRICEEHGWKRTQAIREAIKRF